MNDVREMTIGDLVDICIDYNNRQKAAEEKAERSKKVKHYRMATPEERRQFLDS